MLKPIGDEKFGLCCKQLSQQHPHLLLSYMLSIPLQTLQSVFQIAHNGIHKRKTSICSCVGFSTAYCSNWLRLGGTKTW